MYLVFKVTVTIVKSYILTLLENHVIGKKLQVIFCNF